MTTKTVPVQTRSSTRLKITLVCLSASLMTPGLTAQTPQKQLTPKEAAAVIEFGQQYSKGAREAAVRDLRAALVSYLKAPKSGPFKNVLAKDALDDLDITVMDIKGNYVNNLRMGLLNDGTPGSQDKIKRVNIESRETVVRDWPGVVAEAQKGIGTELPRELLAVISIEHVRPTPPPPPRRR